MLYTFQGKLFIKEEVIDYFFNNAILGVIIGVVWVMLYFITSTITQKIY